MTLPNFVKRLIWQVVGARRLGRAREETSVSEQLLASMIRNSSFYSARQIWRKSSHSSTSLSSVVSPPIGQKKRWRARATTFPTVERVPVVHSVPLQGEPRFCLQGNETCLLCQEALRQGRHLEPTFLCLVSKTEPAADSLGRPKRLSAEVCPRLPKNKRQRQAEIQFRQDFKKAIERGLTAYYKRPIEVPRTWLFVDPVKVAKHVFNAPLSMVLKTPLPPGEVPLDVFLPKEVLDDIKDGNIEAAVVISQLKRNMPLLTKSRVAEAKGKHRKCVVREPADMKAPPESLLERAERYGRIFGSFLRKAEWTVKDALISENASFDSLKQIGGGRAEAKCKVKNCDHGEGVYHHNLWDRFCTEDINQARVAAANANMKARIVTAHHVACNFFRPLQKLMHNRLRQIPIFELTGGMPTEKTFRVFPRFSEQEKTGFNILSADFSCATDGINPDLTKTILFSILQEVKQPKDLSDEEWQMYKQKAISSLTASKLSYSPDSEPVLQNYGQMMGHLLSFPILNLVNFSIYAEYATRVGRLSEIEAEGLVRGTLDTHLRINGDDLISRERTTQIWIYFDIVKECGWELSVGKSYVHPRYGCVNSQFFDFAERRFVAPEYKFGGLQKDASLDAFGQWLTRFDNPIPFVSFYRDWIYTTFGHPRVGGYFKYLPVPIQKTLLKLFNSLHVGDWLRSLAWRELERQQLLEEETLEKEFRATRTDLLDPSYLNRLDSLLAPSRVRVAPILAKMGFQVNSETRAKLDVVLGLDVEYGRFLKSLNQRSVDGEYWEYVGKWRATRLKIEEYKAVEEGSKKMYGRLRRLPKVEFLRRFEEWRRNLVSSRLTQKFIINHPRFLTIPPLLQRQNIDGHFLFQGWKSADQLGLEIRSIPEVVSCTPKVLPEGILWTPDFSDEVSQVQSGVELDDIWGGRYGVTFRRACTTDPFTEWLKESGLSVGFNK